MIRQEIFFGMASLSSALVIASSASATNITYTAIRVLDTVGDRVDSSITLIKQDGPVTLADVVTYDVQIVETGIGTLDFTPYDTTTGTGSSTLSIVGTALVEDGNNLYFDFDTTDAHVSYSYLFQNAAVELYGPIDGLTSVGFEAAYDVPNGISASVDAEGDQVVALAGVPEPATWAMMLLGFGVAGAALRDRRWELR